MKKLKLQLDGLAPMNKEQMRKIKGGYPENCAGGECQENWDCLEWTIWPLCYQGVCVTAGADECLTNGNDWATCCG